jgi:hypothetical protein
MQSALYDEDGERRVFLPTNARDRVNLEHLKRLIEEGRVNLEIVHVDLYAGTSTIVTAPPQAK